MADDDVDSSASFSLPGVPHTATLIVNRFGVITYMDSNVAEVFEYGDRELVGCLFSKLLAPPSDVHYGTLLTNIAARHLETRQSGEADGLDIAPLRVGSRLVEGLTKSGAHFYISLQITELFDSGDMTFLILIERFKSKYAIFTVSLGLVLVLVGRSFVVVVFLAIDVAFSLLRIVLYDCSLFLCFFVLRSVSIRFRRAKESSLRATRCARRCLATRPAS